MRGSWTWGAALAAGLLGGCGGSTRSPSLVDWSRDPEDPQLTRLVYQLQDRSGLTVEVMRVLIPAGVEAVRLAEDQDPLRWRLSWSTRPGAPAADTHTLSVSATEKSELGRQWLVEGRRAGQPELAKCEVSLPLTVELTPAGEYQLNRAER